MMIAVKVKDSSVRSIAKLMTDIGANARKEIAVAVNKTGQKTKASMAKSVSAELAAKQKDIKSVIRVEGKATDQSLQTKIVLKKEVRLPLKDFGAKQNKTGVTYKISKTKGRKTIAGAFQGPRPGVMKRSWKGNVFKRVGKERLPIVKLFGPSAWGVFVVNNLDVPTQAEAQTELEKQVRERMRYLLVKAQGKLKGKQR
jgi:hypothetical protein